MRTVYIILTVITNLVSWCPTSIAVFSTNATMAISGTWMFDRDTDSEWDSAIKAFKTHNGTTILAFGERPIRTTASIARNSSLLRHCVYVNGRHCVDVALQALAAHGASTGEVLTLQAKTQYAVTSMTPCLAAGIGEQHLPPLDNTTREDEFWVVVIPRNVKKSSTRDKCTLLEGSVADLIFIAFPDARYTPSPRDALVRRINAARRHSMRLLLPMVALPARTNATWAVDTPAVPAYLELVKREVRDVEFRFRSNVEHDPIAGFYQTHEMLVSNSSFWTKQYQFYDAMAKTVHSVAPDLAVVLSPYWDVNRGNGEGLGLEVTMAGLMAMAMTDIDVLAPQEGRGTGKAGVYTQDEENSPISDIDPNLARYANVNASSTFSQQFYASTPQLYRQSGEVVKRANRLRPLNRPLELWMNLEAFEHTHTNPCDIKHGTDRTNATRVRRSWELVKSCKCIDSLITFMWDPYFECVPPGYNQSLHQELLYASKAI